MPKEKAPCLSIIILDSVIKESKKYYPETLLEECKYPQENIKIENLIDDDFEKSESNESDIDSNNEAESDNDNNEYIFKSILITLKRQIVCVNNALLDFYLHKSI